MKQLPPGLQDHLESGVTTLSWCWRLTRRDGVVCGFTDHDRNIVFDGTTFEAATGFEASEIKDHVGLSVDNLEVTSALTSDHLSELDLAAGRFDEAKVEIFRVNWQIPDQRLLMRVGSLGQVQRGLHAFKAEVRGLAHYLQQPSGRLYQYTCDADLGDRRCTVALTDPRFHGAGSVTHVQRADRIYAIGLQSFDPDWFDRGLLTLTSGASIGLAIEVKRHTCQGALCVLDLWQPSGIQVAQGDAFTITAGCDKTITTCRTKFANTINFRGFPNMPGNDFITAYATSKSS